MTPQECLVARWNATFEPHSAVTVYLGEQSWETSTDGPAFVDTGGAAFVPVLWRMEDGGRITRNVPIEDIEHRTVFSDTLKDAFDTFGIGGKIPRMAEAMSSA